MLATLTPKVSAETLAEVSPTFAAIVRMDAIS